MIKNVRVLTFPYLEFEFCNVYRGTFGKTLPVIHRHPDAVVILWNPGDYDHVFFLTIAQLLPCLQDMRADKWSMIVFWNEAKGQAARRGPDVGLGFTDQPAPAPEVPQQPPNGDDVDYPAARGRTSGHYPEGEVQSVALLSPRFASPQGFVWEQDVCSLRGCIGEDYTLQFLPDRDVAASGVPV